MKQEELMNQLDFAFRDRRIKPSQCISFKDQKELFIEDNEREGYCVWIVSNTLEFDTSKVFNIINPNGDNMALWAVDGHFFQQGRGPERCDCIFFDNIDFCFAEFKLNAISTNLKTIKDNREKAIGQLRKMIELIEERFSQNNFNYLGYKLEAYLCTPVTYPQKNTSISDFSIEFIENFSVSLFEQNYKIKVQKNIDS